ncbi:exo-alpha-sialidase [Romboutsia weinsteinii]|uniref:exo-alpha-sialidase n=1 Tax=Romboutsia weinsteinii TaxID=2020949 RepID=A0A371J2G5_9FIRM|nr:NPCBM/NEW2 domain-containing protein [Romboutsia weinsteinii]RDY27001.1 exo-alpha-sialidase [Romboutsia weinsteinii]
MKRIVKNLKILCMAGVLSVCSINSVFASDLNANNQPQQTTVFDRTNNVWNAKYFRIPSMQTLSDGSMLAFSDIRYNGAADHAFIDIGAARSTDGGQTWDYQTVMENDRINQTFSRVMDSTTVVTDTGRIILIAGAWNKDGNWASSTTSLRSDWSVQMAYSDNNGQTWSDKVDLTTNTARIKNQPSNTIGWLGGVGSGITMADGTIVMPAQIALRENNSNNYYATIIYSKDNGETWTMGNKVPDARTSENMVIELDGALIMSARNDGSNSRASYISYDLGSTWQTYEPLHGKIPTGNGSGCQGSFIKVTATDGHQIGLISAPKNTVGGYVRDNITVYMIDFDDLSKGVKELCVPYPENGNASGGGYSSLSFNDGKLSILYEADGNIVYKDLTDYYLAINNSSNKDVEYLSDISWEKATTSYGTVRRDVAHDGVNKLILRNNDDNKITYDKGVGIHANGEIVVDLKDKGYKKFETYVGILQNDTSSAKNSSSVKYEFYLDDKLVASTGVMNFNTPKEDISFNITNESKLKIVVNDSGNGNSGDWGVLGDAKFINN